MAEHTVICVGEGSIDLTAGVLAMRYYSCEVDYLPALQEHIAGR
ncbi:MAG: hypothetical protein ACR2JO_04675 [Mycobacteriales bacterium]